MTCRGSRLPARGLFARGLPVAAVLGASLASSACGSPRTYVWADEAAELASPEPGEYRVVPGDVLSVRVWNQESMSTGRARVREDGRISLPFLQDVEAAGATTTELSSRLAGKLTAFVVSPIVTVALEERSPLRVSVLGEVTRPGEFDLTLNAGVLHALAAAGGFSPYAHRDRIFVLRSEPAGKPEARRIRFTFDALVGGSAKATSFRLRRGDVVVVE